MEESEFTTDVAPISTEELRIINDSIADKLGDKRLGEVPALGSVTEVNNFTIQSINGKLYFAAPLSHISFFKWNKTRETTAYVLVSVTNTNDVRLVQEVDGKPISIVYQPSACFGQNLRRHLYMSGYASTPMTDYSFEIDDTGMPWWVVTTYENTIGLGGSEANGILLVHPTTGEITPYTIEEAPAWIDRIQPADFVMKQLFDWGELVEGWYHPSDENELEPSEGYAIVYGADGQCYYYTGITSSGADDGTTAFVMVNTRNKKTYRYNKAGATEAAARRSAMAVQEFQAAGYTATFPITYNVDGVPTYFMSMVGSDGLPKAYAMVNVKNYNTVGSGKDIRSCKRSYQKELSGSGQAQTFSAGANTLTKFVTVKRIEDDIEDGQSNYYMLFEGYNNKIFTASSRLSSEVPLTQIGDELLVSFVDLDQESTPLLEFDNQEYGVLKTAAQLQKELYFQMIKVDEKNQEELKTAHSQFERLTDAEKLELLERLRE